MKGDAAGDARDQTGTARSPDRSPRFERWFVACVFSSPKEEDVEEKEFHQGEPLWLRGKPVIFIEYHFLSNRRVRGAVVRAPNEAVRVVPSSKLARDKAESFARDRAIPAS